MEIVLQGGRVIDPAVQLDAVRDVLVRDGRIAAVGENLASQHPEAVVRRLRLVVLIAAVSSCVFSPGASAKQSITSLAPGKSVSMVVTQPLKTQGEWVIKVRVSGDGEKKVTVRTRRGKGASFAVLNTASQQDLHYCQGAAGSIYCDQITVAAVPAPGTWSYTAKNTGNNKVNVTLTVTWRAVGSAG